MARSGGTLRAMDSIVVYIAVGALFAVLCLYIAVKELRA